MKVKSRTEMTKEDVEAAYYLLSTAHNQAQQENERLQKYIKLLENMWWAPVWARLKRVFGRGEHWLDVS